LALLLLCVAGGAGLADRASAAPADESPIGVPPDPVANPAADFYQGQLLLSWLNPPSVDWIETVVRGAQGTVAPRTSAQGFAVYAGQDRSATVTDLAPGTPYSFSFFARDLEGKEAGPARLTVSGAKLTMRVNPSQVVNGASVQFTVTVRDVLTNKPLSNRVVDLFGRRPGTDQIIQVGSARTTPQGKAFIGLRPPENFDYAAVYFGEGTNLGGYSADLTLPVAFLVKAKPSAKAVGVGQTFTVAATIDPATSGQVVLEELIRGGWTEVAARKLNGAGKAILRFKANASGTHTYRFRKTGTKRYAAGTSKTFTITAR
jgi:hypothetical protein